MTAKRRTCLVLAALCCLLVALLLPAQADPVTFTGTVLLPDGQPAAGATVRGVGFGRIWSPLPTVTTTGPDGTFSINADLGKGGEVRLLALKPGYVPAEVALEQVAPVTLRLGGNPATYHGRVCDPDGKPLAGAQISLRGVRLSNGEEGIGLLGLESLAQATSGPDGTFALSDLPADSTAELAVTAPGRAPAMSMRHVGGATLPIVLQPGAVVTGRVTWKGQPVVGVHVQVYSGDWPPTAVTDAQGNYRFDQAGVGQKFLQLLISDPPAGSLAPQRWLPVLAPGQTLTGQDFDLLGTAMITGRITEAGTGRGLEGLAVGAGGAGLKPGQETVTYVATGADGTYELHVAPGHLWLYASGPERERLSRSRSPWEEDYRPWTVAPKVPMEVYVAEGQTLAGQDFVMTPPPPLPPAPPVPQWRGHVFRPDGTPAVGVEVGTSGGGPDRTQRTDAEGAFSLDSMSPWEARLPRGLGFHPQFLLARDTAAGLVAGVWAKQPETDLRLTLTKGAYILTGALDRQGRPQPDVGISAMLLEGAVLAVADTDQHGRVRLGPLPPGYAIQLWPEGENEGFSAGEQWREMPEPALKPGEERTVPHTVVNRPWGQVSGRVVDAQGRPLARVLVATRRWGDAAATDQQGRFTLTGIQDRGWVWLLAADPRKPLFALRQVNPATEPIAQLVLRPLGGISGMVVDERGQPLAGAQVRVAQDYIPRALIAPGPSPEEFGPEAGELAADAGIGRSESGGGLTEWGATVLTDAQGKWQVGGLLAGADYLLFFAFGTKDRTLEAGPRKITAGGGAIADQGKIVLRGKPAGER